MSKHTPGPWIASRTNAGAIPSHFQPPEVLGRNGACCVASQLGNGPEAEANTDRIAACVNACKGINPEAVPELLKALREYVERHEAACNPAGLPEYEQARAAINKAEGKTLQKAEGKI